MRRLAAEERALWDRLARTVRRLDAPKPVEPGLPQVTFEAGQNVPIAPPSPSPRPGQTLDGGWDKRLTSGRLEPDRTLDLHGLTLEAAHRALERTLGTSIARGDRVILVITGKLRGEPGVRAAPGARGVIRASIGDWLDASAYAGRIAAIRPASTKHGGSGALYVVLRRDRARD